MEIYKLKLNALECFYSLIDYECSCEQLPDYSRSTEYALSYRYNELSSIEKIVWSFTILSRFERVNRLISEEFAEEINCLLLQYNSESLNKEIALLDDCDKQMLEEDYEMACAYMKHFYSK